MLNWTNVRVQTNKIAVDLHHSMAWFAAFLHVVPCIHPLPSGSNINQTFSSLTILQRKIWIKIEKFTTYAWPVIVTCSSNASASHLWNTHGPAVISNQNYFFTFWPECQEATMSKSRNAKTLKDVCTTEFRYKVRSLI